MRWRGLAILAVAAASCAAPPAPVAPLPVTASNDCAVITALVTEHYRFNAENLPPTLKPGGDDGWQPACDFSAQGFTFTDYAQPLPGADPRTSFKWVAFHKPTYDGTGAIVTTEIMHGPLAGIGYECRLHSGVAGWTVGECRTSWVS